MRVGAFTAPLVSHPTTGKPMRRTHFVPSTFVIDGCCTASICGIEPPSESGWDDVTYSQTYGIVDCWACLSLSKDICSGDGTLADAYEATLTRLEEIREIQAPFHRFNEFTVEPRGPR